MQVMSKSYQIAILGATYGSLLSTKLLLGGHNVTLVGLPNEVELINRTGTRVRIPIKDQDQPLEVDSQVLTGSLRALPPEAVLSVDYDLIVLAMQEPQYAQANVRTLLKKVAQSETPCLSIMNMPPLAFLARIPGFPLEACRYCYTDASVWDAFDPALITLCSPDPQAYRPPNAAPNVLQVGLPTNFKAARFESENHTGVLRQLEKDIEVARYDTSNGPVDVPVKLKVHDSVFVPLAKWCMLLAGNYRCIQKETMRSIREAVHADLEETKRVYQFVMDLCIDLGANKEDLVPFEKYAHAAESLQNPSSAARALFGGAPNIERVDLLIQTISAQKNRHDAALNEIVDLVNRRLEINRQDN
jgi:hypothetical protein